MNRRDVLKLGSAFGMATAIPNFGTSAEPEADSILVADADPDSMGLADLINEAMPVHSYLNFESVVTPIVQSAYAVYCQEYIECQMTSQGNILTASGDQIPDMMDINKEYHSNFTYITDQEQYRTLEDIRPAQPMDDVNPERLKMVAGDCDDYALGLMNEFNHRLGIDYSAMSMVVVDTEPDVDGPLHAVLMVRTDQGDMIFNNDGTSKFVDEYPEWDFIEAQSLTNKGVWQSVSIAPPGVEPAMVEVPDFTDEEFAQSMAQDIPLPRPRPDKDFGM